MTIGMLTGGIRHDEMRRRNRSLVISAVRRAGKPSRTEIAGLTGLSQSTISAIAADLIAEEIMLETIHETMSAPPRRGRPQVALTPNPRAAKVVCVHLSFNHLAATLVDYSGNVIQSAAHRLNTLALSRQGMLDAAIHAVHEIAGQENRFQRISFAVQGIIDAEGNEVLWSPIMSHSNIPFGPALREAFGVPVDLQNDCNSIATALHWKNPERYGKNFIAILLSHGIGMGLMLNGRIFTGIQSSGVEFGHMTHQPNGSLCRCGHRGCIEAYAGSYAIWRRAQGDGILEDPLGDTHGVDLQALLVKARANDEHAKLAFREAGEAIGFGLGSLFSLIDPAPVALVGHGTAAFEFLEPEIRQSLGRTAGGQNAKNITFEVWPDEVPLIQEGCAMEALSRVDHDIFGQGPRPDGPGLPDQFSRMA